MPLFMDRHEVPGVTAEQVAQAHVADLDMGAKFGVQFLAYWFDADQGEAFCLDAPLADGAEPAVTLDALCECLSDDFDIEHSTFQLEDADRRRFEERSHA